MPLQTEVGVEGAEEEAGPYGRRIGGERTKDSERMYSQGNNHRLRSRGKGGGGGKDVTR